VSHVGGHRIALFLTGNRHAGENLADLLKRRQAALNAPILPTKFGLFRM